MDENPRPQWLEEIPSVLEILEGAKGELGFEELVGKVKPSELARMLERKCHEIYRRYEEKVWGRWKGEVDPAKLEQSLQQSRMSRAGKTTEEIFKLLINSLGIEYERNARKRQIGGEKPDFLIPDRETFDKDPSKAVILSVKRKVRERWREVVGEAYILRKIHRIPDNVWFATLECDIDDCVVDTMTKLDIRVYIPDDCYEQFKRFQKAYPLSQLFEDLLKFGKRRQLKLNER